MEVSAELATSQPIRRFFGSVNSDDIDYYVRKNEGKILWFSADCTRHTQFISQEKEKSTLVLYISVAF